MPYKCFSCGLSFDTAEEFVKHKLAHQEQPEKRGLICLRCGKPVPVDSSKANYRGDMTCPSCGRRMKVVIQNGEVALAISKEDTGQTKEELLKQYHKWMVEYMTAKDIIDSLVPAAANLSKGERIPTIIVTEDLLAKFLYAEAKMTHALRKRQEIHEKLYKLQQSDKTN